MRRLVEATLLGLLVACGSGGTAPVEDDPVLDEAVLTSIDVALDGLGGTTYEILGENLPGFAGATYPVRFTSTQGPVFDDCATTEITGVVDWVSDGILRGTAPATHVLADTRARVTVELPDGPLASAGPIATFLGTPDATQDQDGNGVRDGCDPNTYDFEQDPLGGRPADATQLGTPTGLEIAEVDGDQVARYAGASTGSSDRLERVLADFPHQDTTVYVDWDGTASVGSIELWSEGSWSDNAGAGLIVQIRSGLIYFFERVWRSVPSVIGPALPPDGRMRIRVRKGAGTTSTVHIDVRNGTLWDEDHAVFPIADDRNYRGRATVLSEYSAGLRGIKRITVVHAVPADPLTVAQRPEGLMPWKLFQRDLNDEATIPIDALYRLTGAGQLQARVVHSDNGLVLAGHDWANHSQALGAAPDGSRANLDLDAVPTGGNYDVHVRLLDGTGSLVSQVGVHNVAVGDVYICAGQSNMSGYSGNLSGATAPIPEVHRFHNDGRWDQAVEPCDAGAFQLDRISFENPLHSLMLPFARGLYEATGVPVAVVPTSLGGTNLHTQWQRYDPAPAWRAFLYGSMLHRARVATGGVAPAGFLWFQGESDAINARTTAQYVADLEQLIDQVRTDLGVPDLLAIVAQLGTFASANLDLWLPIQEAERQVARNDARVAVVTTVDAPRSDGIHFNVTGYQTIGARFADAARVLRFGHTIDPLTELVSAAVGASTDQIDLTYDAPVFGGNPTLYSVTDNTGAATVTAVQISGAVVTLTLDRALDANATVGYGRAVIPTAAWVVDASSIPVPCFFAVPVN